MKKIKKIIYNKIVAFDFKAEMLKDNIIVNICRELNLLEVYIDLYGVDKDFYKVLAEKNKGLVMSTIKNELSNLTIRAKIDEIQTIIGILINYNFDELNVWDIYTDWEQYLEDKVTYKPILKTIQSKVYINYNINEGNKVEIYLDPNYNSEKIYDSLKKIIN